MQPADGTSLLPLLDKPNDTRLAFAEGRPLELTRARLCTQTNDPIPHYRVYIPGLAGKWRSVRSTTHKLIYIPRNPEAEWELYDTAHDPGETTNLVGRPATRATERTLTQALAAWMAADPGVTHKVKVTQQVFEQLKALGYAEGEFGARGKPAR